MIFCIGTNHIAINTTFSTINSIGCGRNHKIALHLPYFRRFAFIELSDPTRIQLFHTASLPVVLHQTLDENDASSRWSVLCSASCNAFRQRALLPVRARSAEFCGSNCAVSSRDIPIRQLPKTHKSFLMMWGFVSIFCSQKKRRVGSASPLCRQASLHLLCTMHNLCSESCTT